MTLPPQAASRPLEPLQDLLGDGRVVRLQACSRDVLETADALRRSQELLDSVLASSLDAVMVFDAVRANADSIEDFVFRLVSPAAEAMIGRRSEALVGKRLLAELPGHRTEGIFDLYRDVVETGEPRSAEFSYAHDGIYAWFQCRAVKQSDGLAVTLRVVTEQKQAEEALRESEECFRTAFEDAAIGKALVDAEGWFLRTNPALCELVGYDEATLLRKTFHEITHPDDIDADLAHMRRMRDGEASTYALEKRYLHRDDHIVWVLKTVTSVRDRAGAVRYFIAEVADITTRKEAERLKSEFISVVSHELRTPLTSIAGSLRLIASQVPGPVPGPVQRMLDIAQRNSDRLVRLINDILDVQKAEAGGLQLHPAPHALADLLASAVEANAGYGSRHGIQIALREVPDVEVEVDSDRFMQIMANLLSNAVKFSPEHGEVEVVASMTAGGVRISVTDRGPGISVAFRPRIFDRFAQADSSSTRSNEGTGLGLSITKSLVELHSGRIGFETEVGLGTTFHVDFPAYARQAPSETPREPRFLVVEDDDADLLHIVHKAVGDLALSGASFTLRGYPLPPTPCPESSPPFSASKTIPTSRSS